MQNIVLVKMSKIMTREEQIYEFANSQVDCEFFDERLHEGIIIGAKWADENPDSKHIYTKKQLMDMGFAFTTNGDIVTPSQSNEDLKKYLEYQKRKFIEKAKAWIKNCFTGPFAEGMADNIADEFEKYMEE